MTAVQKSKPQSKNGTEVVRGEPTRGGQMYTPRVDIYETENELLLFAELPGVRPDGVDLHYEKGELTLHGRVTPCSGRPQECLLEEYEEGDFFRAFTIHESIDASRIEAECKNGLLT